MFFKSYTIKISWQIPCDGSKKSYGLFVLAYLFEVSIRLLFTLHHVKEDRDCRLPQFCNMTDAYSIHVAFFIEQTTTQGEGRANLWKFPRVSFQQGAVGLRCSRCIMSKKIGIVILCHSAMVKTFFMLHKSFNLHERKNKIQSQLVNYKQLHTSKMQKQNSQTFNLNELGEI